MSTTSPSVLPRVALVTGIYPPDIGGPATHIADLRVALQEAGFPVAVLTLADVPHVEEHNGVVRIPRSWPWPVRLGAVAWWLVANQDRYDVVYATGLQPSAVAGARLARKRVIVKIVGDPAWERGRREGLTAENFDAFQATPGGAPRLRAMRVLRDWSLRNADEILTPSAFLASVVERWLGGPADVNVIPNGVRLPHARVRPQIADRLELHLIWVGRLIPLKRVGRIVDAVARVPGVQLTVVGDGSEREPTQKLVEEHGLSNRVRFTGVVDHERVLELVSDADALVLASEVEGLPHVAIEALALGVPVVSTKVGGTSEIVSDGESGLLVDASVEGFRDAFARLNDDRGLRSALRAGAFAEGGRWTFDRTADQIQELLIHGQRRPRIVFLGKTMFRSLTPDLAARLEIICRGLDPRLVNVGEMSTRRLGRTVAYVLPAFLPRVASGVMFYLLGPAVAIALATRRQQSAIVCQSPYEGAGAIALARVVPRTLRPEVVVEVHGDWRAASRLYGSPRRRAIAPVADRIAEWAIQRADRVRVVGSYTEKLVRDAGVSGPVDRFIAFNDLARFLEPTRKLPAAPTVLFAGVLEFPKGLDVLLEAWVHVLERVPRAKLRVVGEGTQRRALTSLTSTLGIAASVGFVGRIPREEMPPELDASSLLVLPSRSEGLGLVVLEAMARGRAVVASDVGGIPELVRDGSTGYLVPTEDSGQLTDAIVRLLQDRRLATSLGRAGRRAVEDMDASLGFEAGMNRLRRWVLDR